MTLIDDALALFGLQIEQRRNTPSRPGVRYADGHEIISDIFAGDAARQQAGSAFFSGGQRRTVIPNNASALGAESSQR
jgi:hypothetical protein